MIALDLTAAEDAARALLGSTTPETEQALLAAIAYRGGWSMPDGRTTRLQSRAIGAWLDRVTPRHGGARVGAGRKPTVLGKRKVIVVLDGETAAIWDTIDGDRSAWVRARLRERDP